MLPSALGNSRKHTTIVTCGDVCGCRSTLADQFQRRGGGATCPACAEAEAERQGRRMLFSMFCALGSVVLVALFLPWAPPLMVALAEPLLVAVVAGAACSLA